MRKLSACLMAALLSATPALAEPVTTSQPSAPVLRSGATVGEAITTIADHLSTLASKLSTSSTTSVNATNASTSVASPSETRALIRRMFPWLKLRDEQTATATAQASSSPSG